MPLQDTLNVHNLTADGALTATGTVSFPAASLTGAMLALTAVASQIGWVSVADYKQPSDPDDTLSFTRACAACPVNGVVLVPPRPASPYILQMTAASPHNNYQESWAVPIPNANISIVGLGAPDDCVLKFANGSFQAGVANQAICVMLGIGGGPVNDTSSAGGTSLSVGTVRFANLTFEGNAAGQTWGALSATNKYMPFFAHGNHLGTAPNATLIVENCKFNNWNMPSYGSGDTSGRAVEDFGFTKTIVKDSEFFNCDTALWLTVVQATDLNTLRITKQLSNLRIMQSTRSSIYVETTSGIQATNIVIDNLNATGGPGDGIRVLCSSGAPNISGLQFHNVELNNCNYGLAIGYGGTLPLKDSHFSNILARSCIVGIQIQLADSTCTFSNLTADTCGAGTLKFAGQTKQASIELNNTGAVSIVRVSNPRVINPQVNYCFAVGGAFRIDGGMVDTSLPAFNLINALTSWPANSRISRLEGYTPIGAVTPQNIGGSATFPATGVAVTNSYPFDVEIYYACTGMSALAKNGTAVNSLYTNGLLRLAPGETAAWTYSGGATGWQWFGSNT